MSQCYNLEKRPARQVYENAVRTLKGRKCGDSVWACAFEIDVKKCGLSLQQNPIRGILVHSDTEEADEKDSQNSLNYSGLQIRYFVPENTKGTGYAWSKAVKVFNRVYANTYEKSVKLYEEMIVNWENWFKCGTGFCKEFLY